jgi:hypothetical protein
MNILLVVNIAVAYIVLIVLAGVFGAIGLTIYMIVIGVKLKRRGMIFSELTVKQFWLGGLK